MKLAMNHIIRCQMKLNRKNEDQGDVSKLDHKQKIEAMSFDLLKSELELTKLIANQEVEKYRKRCMELENFVSRLEEDLKISRERETKDRETINNLLSEIERNGKEFSEKLIELKMQIFDLNCFMETRKDLHGLQVSNSFEEGELHSPTETVISTPSKQNQNTHVWEISPLQKQVKELDPALNSASDPDFDSHPDLAINSTSDFIIIAQTRSSNAIEIERKRSDYVLEEEDNMVEEECNCDTRTWSYRTDQGGERNGDEDDTNEEDLSTKNPSKSYYINIKKDAVNEEQANEGNCNEMEEDDAKKELAKEDICNRMEEDEVIEAPLEEAEVSNATSSYFPDLTTHFTTEKIFDSKEEVRVWCLERGKSVNCVIVTRGTQHRNISYNWMGSWMLLVCERSGVYCSHKGKNYVPKTHIKRRRRGSKKCGCPFALKATCGSDGKWLLKVKSGHHNHMLSRSLASCENET